MKVLSFQVNTFPEPFDNLCPAKSCAALVVDRVSNRVLGKHKQINLNPVRFERDDTVLTFVNLHMGDKDLIRSEPVVNRCCQRYEHNNVR